MFQTSGWITNGLRYIYLLKSKRCVRRGYELRNTIIWVRTNIVNNIGIFGWPSNYITMGTTLRVFVRLFGDHNQSEEDFHMFKVFTKKNSYLN
jgi:hypothetical protein